MRADRSWRAIENGDLVLLDDVPPAIPGRKVGSAFVDHAGGAVRQRTIDDIGMPGDPADIGRGPVDVVILDVEDDSVRGRNASEIAAGGVQDAFRLGSGSGGVQEVEHVFALHLLRLTVRRLLRHDVVPPDITPFGPVHLLTSALDHEHLLDGWGGLQRFVHIDLEPGCRAAAIPSIGCDHRLGLGIVDAIGKRSRRESTEHHRVGGAQARAGQHRHGKLRDHGHVDGDAVAASDTKLLQGVGASADVVEQFLVGDDARITRLAFPVVGDAITLAGIYVPVEAVVGDVDLPTVEPPSVGRLPVENGVPWLEPIELGCFSCPETFEVLGGFGVDRRGVDLGGGGEAGRRGKVPVFGQKRLDFLVSRSLFCHLRQFSVRLIEAQPCARRDTVSPGNS